MSKPAGRRVLRRTLVLMLSLAWAVPAGASGPARPLAEPFLGLPEYSNLASPEGWAVEKAFPGVSFTNPVFLIAEPSGARFWVLEQQGRILSFANDPDADEVRVVLDLQAQTQGTGDSGMLSMAFHPDFDDEESASEGLIFVAYSFRKITEPNAPLRSRVSRFHVDRTTGVADPESELVLINQLDQSPWHQGAALLFRPSDGYLYVTVGDEGGIACSLDNCQRIDRDLFSGVLRLDVDNLGEGVSHPPPRQPESGKTAYYSIPDDNPFVGREGVLEEFYAIGLRSPHRMTLDPVEDLLWIGDVGQAAREEIDVLASGGANFQWSVLEGSLPIGETTDPPDPLIGTWTPPIFEYDRLQGGTVIGGYVYRGQALPELQGRYLHGDFLSGRIWSLTYERNGDQVTAIDNDLLLSTPFRGRTNGLVSFGLDPDGEVYLVTLGAPANLYKLVRAAADPGNMPRTLSATGLFEDLEGLEPVEALVPYDVKVPLWSDGTSKRRWMSVPSDGVVEYSESDPWRFPPGTVFVKHFEINLDESKTDDPETIRRLETRVLVVQPDYRVYGVTYRWRADGSDADLLVKGDRETLTIRDHEGVERLQKYDFPGPIDCLSCHDEGAGFVLGPRARQFAGVAGDQLDEEDDQLSWLAAAGFLDRDELDLNRHLIPDLAALDDESASLELRVRSYLDVNCSHCHGSQDLDRSLWDARVTSPLNRQRIVYGSPLGAWGPGDHIVTPGDPEASVMLLRASSAEPGLRMPPLARNLPDQAFASVLEDWILALEPEPLDPPLCGDSVAPYDVVLAGDALGVLRSAVGLAGCWDCICDVDSNAGILASDALLVLRRSVDPETLLDCPVCS